MECIECGGTNSVLKSAVCDMKKEGKDKILVAWEPLCIKCRGKYRQMEDQQVYISEQHPG